VLRVIWRVFPIQTELHGGLNDLAGDTNYANNSKWISHFTSAVRSLTRSRDRTMGEEDLYFSIRQKSPSKGGAVQVIRLSFACEAKQGTRGPASQQSGRHSLVADVAQLICSRMNQTKRARWRDSSIIGARARQSPAQSLTVQQVKNHGSVYTSSIQFGQYSCEIDLRVPQATSKHSALSETPTLGTLVISVFYSAANNVIYPLPGHTPYSDTKIPSVATRPHKHHETAHHDGNTRPINSVRRAGPIRCPSLSRRSNQCP
jgi:hypothetical protein